MTENDRFSEWYPREASSAVFAVEALGGGLRVLVETKDRGDPDAGAVSAAAEIDATGPGVHAVPAWDLKDFIRLRVTRDSPDREWCHFRLLRPSWGEKDALKPPSEGAPSGDADPQA